MATELPRSAADVSDTTGRAAAGRRRAWSRWALTVVAVLTLIGASTQILLDPGRTPTAGDTGAAGSAPADPGQPAPATTALNGLSGPPTLFGHVSAVLDPVTMVVEVAQRPITVRVIGADDSGTPPCARDQATAFARTTLLDQDVTLVPDPTLPAGPDTQSWPAYLVLATQQSYTDLALRAGWVSAGPGRYRPGFLDEEQQARIAGAGMWGPPCNR